MRLKHGEKVSGVLAVLKFGYLEGLPCGIDLAPEVLLCSVVVFHLAQRSFHIGKGVGDSTFITIPATRVILRIE